MSTTCVMAHRVDPERPRSALGGLLLCAGHHQALTRLITPASNGKPGELAAYYGALAAVLAPGRRAGSAPVSGTRENSLPINPTVVDVRDRIRGSLASWARVHVEELAVRGPERDDPATVAVWLSRYVDWSAAQPFVDEYLVELIDLRYRAARCYDATPHRMTCWIGPCLDCDGQMYATTRSVDDPRPSVIACDTCESVYEPSQWLRLGKRWLAIHQRTEISA